MSNVSTVHTILMKPVCAGCRKEIESSSIPEESKDKPYTDKWVCSSVCMLVIAQRGYIVIL